MLLNIVLFLCDEPCSYYLDIIIDNLCTPYIMILWIVFKSTFPCIAFNLFVFLQKRNVMNIIRLSVLSIAILLLTLACNTNNTNYNNDDEQEHIVELFPVCNGDSGNHEHLWNIYADTTYRWGYIDKTGDLIIDYKYKGADWFYDGLASVKIGDLWGFIDEKDNIVIKPIRFGSGRFKEGIVGVKDGFIDKSGRLVIKINRDTIFEIGECSDGMIWFCSGKSWQNRKYGYMNSKGEVVIKPQFDAAYDFSEEMARVGYNYSKNGEKRYGFINKEGKFVINPVFQNADDFSEGLACVQRNSQVGFIDTTGQLVILLYYTNEYVYPDHIVYGLPRPIFSEGYACISYYNGWWTPNIFVEYINKEGNHINESWVLNRHNDGHAFSEGLAAVADYNHNSKHKLWGYINYNGETIIERQFDEAKAFHNGLACVLIAGKMAYINKEGTIVWIEN